MLNIFEDVQAAATVPLEEFLSHLNVLGRLIATLNSIITVVLILL